MSKYYIPSYNWHKIRNIDFYIIPVTALIIEGVDSISRDERDVPLTQYITNA